MTDRCPRCQEWYLVHDARARGARCTNTRCGYTEEVSYEGYLRKYADRSRMVVFPPELGGGLSDEWKGFVLSR